MLFNKPRLSTTRSCSILLTLWISLHPFGRCSSHTGQPHSLLTFKHSSSRSNSSPGVTSTSHRSLSRKLRTSISSFGNSNGSLPLSPSEVCTSVSSNDAGRPRITSVCTLRACEKAGIHC
ncbi:hypothetical protein OF83DRAFT_844271 [Amylostereum chailletii]|nr:hypothetical protein OF83DRAFT_844271 [Amylostereum chailletii]